MNGQFYNIHQFNVLSVHQYFVLYGMFENEVSLLSQERHWVHIFFCCISCSICRPLGDCLNTSTAPWTSALLTFQCQGKERKNCLLNAMFLSNPKEEGPTPQSNLQCLQHLYKINYHPSDTRNVS